jgi:ABC-type transport system involved in cytochrome c biogenesis permease subunit
MFEHMTLACFGATYAIALLLEAIGFWRPMRLLQISAGIIGAAGLVAHTLYLSSHQPALTSTFGSALYLSWALAVFYVVGTVHHRRQAWGIFALPVILGLIVAAVISRPADYANHVEAGDSATLQAWRTFHLAMLLLAAIGVCVAAVASLMYLVQARRLKNKAFPAHRPLLSLERLESMNRRAINLAFPLLTAGVLVGIGLALARPDGFTGWNDPKIAGTLLLWLLFALLLYLRVHVRLGGTRLAVLTIMAFGLLLFTLASAHTSIRGGMP